MSSEVKKMLVEAIEEKKKTRYFEYRSQEISLDEICAYNRACDEILELVEGILP